MVSITPGTRKCYAHKFVLLYGEPGYWIAGCIECNARLSNFQNVGEQIETDQENSRAQDYVLR